MQKTLNNQEIENLFIERLPDCFFQLTAFGFVVETSIIQHNSFFTIINEINWWNFAKIAPQITNHEPITAYLQEDNHYYKATLIGNLVDYKYPWYYTILDSIFADQHCIEYTIEKLEEVDNLSQMTNSDLLLS